MEFRLLAKALLLPPLLQLLMIALGVFLYYRRPVSARLLLYFGLCSLWFLATPWVATGLARITERYPAVEVEQRSSFSGAAAIVVLTAGQLENTPEYGEPVSSPEGLRRARYAAFLQRRLGLPILVSGGSVYGDDRRSLASTMAYDIEYALGGVVTYLEQQSRTTAENAYFSYQMLQKEQKTRVVLVTSATHMARAVYLFEQVGFNVIAAPTAFSEPLSFRMRHLIPDGESLFLSQRVFHEWLGHIWVRVF